MWSDDYCQSQGIYCLLTAFQHRKWQPGKYSIHFAHILNHSLLFQWPHILLIFFSRNDKWHAKLSSWILHLSIECSASINSNNLLTRVTEWALNRQSPFVLTSIFLIGFDIKKSKTLLCTHAATLPVRVTNSMRLFKCQNRKIDADINGDWYITTVAFYYMKSKSWQKYQIGSNGFMS